MSNRLPGSTGKLTLGSVEPGKKRGRAGEKEKKENKTENETSPGPRKEL